MRIYHRKIHNFTHITYNHNKSFCTICLNLLPGNRLLVLIICHKSQLFDVQSFIFRAAIVAAAAAAVAITIAVAAATVSAEAI